MIKSNTILGTASDHLSAAPSLALAQKWGTETLVVRGAACPPQHSLVDARTAEGGCVAICLLQIRQGFLIQLHGISGQPAFQLSNIPLQTEKRRSPIYTLSIPCHFYHQHCIFIDIVLEMKLNESRKLPHQVNKRVKKQNEQYLFAIHSEHFTWLKLILKLVGLQLKMGLWYWVCRN